MRKRVGNTRFSMPIEKEFFFMPQAIQTTQQIDIQQLGALRQEYKVGYSGLTRVWVILYPLAAIISLLTGLIQSGDPYSINLANGSFFLAAILALPSLYYLLYPVIYRS